MNQPDYPIDATEEQKAQIQAEFANDQADKLKNKDRKPPIANANA